LAVPRSSQKAAPPAAMQALSIIVNKVWEKRDEIKRCAREVNIGLRALISGNDFSVRLRT
jgi:hypothetical protein